MKNSMRELIAHAATQLKLDGIPEELQKEILARLGEIIWKRLVLDVFNVLSPEAQTHCKMLADAAKHDELYRFFAEQVPNFEEIAKTSTEKTIAEFLKK